MKQTLTLLLGLTCLASQTHAKTIIVNVGDGGLVFKPDSVTAAPGDVVQFDYVQGVSYHSLTTRDYVSVSLVIPM